MNDLLVPVRSPGQDQHLLAVPFDDEVRLSLADRVSVRVGVWLLLRARRRASRPRGIDLHVQADIAAQARAGYDDALLQERLLHSRIL